MKWKEGVGMKKKISKRTNITAFLILMIFLVAGGIVLYYQYMQRQQKSELEQTPTTETEKLIAKDLTVGYPETPVEVMKLWGRLNQCVYNAEELEEEQFHQLFLQMRVMYSKELLKQNPEEDHWGQLQSEVSDFRAAKHKISSYSADTGVSVKYKTINEQESAKVRVSYLINLNRGKGHTKLYQQFILIKEDGKWKILGFKDEPAEQNQTK